MLNDDNAGYFKYNGPLRVEKAMHTLEGIVQGIAIDSEINSLELGGLIHWLNEHRQYSDRHPFNEVVKTLDRVLEDGFIDDEESADLLWMCQQLQTKNDKFCEVTSDMQRLQGLLAGIIADGEILPKELKGLQNWMDEREHLRKCWPYDELQAAILLVMKDGIIDDNEHEMLMQFFGEFASYPGHRSVTDAVVIHGGAINGLCAVCPEIEFSGRRFCFTGKSERANRREIESLIRTHGGEFASNLVANTDFLIVGNDGNPCWSFACYGRKVEQAVKFRKRGKQILIVHEFDFWDAVEDLT